MRHLGVSQCPTGLGAYVGSLAGRRAAALRARHRRCFPGVEERDHDAEEGGHGCR